MVTIKNNNQWMSEQPDGSLVVRRDIPLSGHIRVATSGFVVQSVEKAVQVLDVCVDGLGLVRWLTEVVAEAGAGAEAGTGQDVSVDQWCVQGRR